MEGDAWLWAGDGEDHAADAGWPPLPCRSPGQRDAPGDRPSALGVPFCLPQESRPQERSEPERHLQTRPANRSLPPDPRPPGAVPRLRRDLVVGGPCRSMSLKHKCKLNAHIGYKSRNQRSAPSVLPCAGSALASMAAPGHVCLFTYKHPEFEFNLRRFAACSVPPGSPPPPPPPGVHAPHSPVSAWRPAPGRCGPTPPDVTSARVSCPSRPGSPPDRRLYVDFICFPSGANAAMSLLPTLLPGSPVCPKQGSVSRGGGKTRPCPVRVS